MARTLSHTETVTLTATPLPPLWRRAPSPPPTCGRFVSTPSPHIRRLVHVADALCTRLRPVSSPCAPFSLLSDMQCEDCGAANTPFLRSCRQPDAQGGSGGVCGVRTATRSTRSSSLLALPPTRLPPHLTPPTSSLASPIHTQAPNPRFPARKPMADFAFFRRPKPAKISVVRPFAHSHALACHSLASSRLRPRPRFPLALTHQSSTCSPSSPERSAAVAQVLC